jgi:hypothetical protein
MTSETGKIEFRCACGKVYRVAASHAGKQTKCPGCGVLMQVPKIGASAAVSVPATSAAVHEGRPAEVQRHVPAREAHGLPASVQTTADGGTNSGDFVNGAKGRFRVPTSFGELLGYLLLTWTGFGVIAFLASFISPLFKFGSLILFVAATVAVGQQLWILLQARQKVLTKKEVPLLWGLVKLVAWDPIEGILFLKNKAMGFCDDDLDDGHGGIRFIYPVFGEEIALRVPLETQTLSVTDDNVLTREYLSVMIRGTMKWRIRDIKNFYLLVSRELRSTMENSDGRLETAARSVQIGDANAKSAVDRLVQSAITWLRLIAEEQTRIVVSQVSSGLLIAERLKEEIPEVKDSFLQSRMLAGPQGTSSEWQNAANGLAARIEEAVRQRVGKYGIGIEEVALQEIRLPEGIVEQCIEACKAAYLPVLAQRKGLAKRAELSAEVDLLGREAVATREIVAAAPGFTLVDFVSNFLAKQMNGGGAGIGLNAVTAGALASAVGTGALPAPNVS